MTKEEREKILMAVGSSDDSVCADDTVDRLQRLFPDEPFRKEYDEETGWGRRYSHAEWAAEGKSPEEIAWLDAFHYDGLRRPT